MITIVKVYDKQVIGTHREYCGRPGKGQVGLLGNPFWMNDESKRNKVCDDYATWFKTNKPKRVDELIEIAKTQDIELACFCQSPKDIVKKRCHCETIKAYIEKQLNKPVLTYVNGDWVDARTLTM
jgi:hypothetical protein